MYFVSILKLQNFLKWVYLYLYRKNAILIVSYNLMQNNAAIVDGNKFSTYLKIIIWSVFIIFRRSGYINTEGWISISWNALERKR